MKLNRASPSIVTLKAEKGTVPFSAFEKCADPKNKEPALGGESERRLDLIADKQQPPLEGSSQFSWATTHYR